MRTISVLSRAGRGFGAILLFPLRALEQARGWWRLGLLLLYIAIALPILAMLWRRSQLAGIPDVGNTFNPAASRPTAGVPDDQNAFVLYRRAAERFREMNNDEKASFNRASLLWSRADAVLRGWVAEHHEAVALVCAGSARPDAYLQRPVEPADQLAVDQQTEMIRRLSWIGEAALLEAGRVHAEGDPTAAWALLKAALRLSRHLEQAVPKARRTATMMLNGSAYELVSEWAKASTVEVALMRRALDDVTAVEALTQPLSDFYREEYQDLDNLLKYPELRIAERARLLADAKEAIAVPLFTREMGHPPASPAEAMRRYLPILGDRADRDEAEPLPERAGTK
jgi:hypothetical protein